MGVFVTVLNSIRKRSLPYEIDFSILGDGVLPSPWVGSTWAISSGVVANTPTMGSELLTDGAVENWTDPNNLTSWSEFTAGTSTVNQEGAVVHGGASSGRLDIDAGNNAAEFYQTISNSVGDWVYIDHWHRSSASGKTGYAKLGSGSTINATNPGTTWTNYVNIPRAAGANTFVECINAVSASASQYFDDISAKILTIGTLISYYNNPIAGVGAAKSNWTGGTNHPFGTIGWWDAANPLQNCILAYHDGTSAVLQKYVGATMTQLLRVTAAYSAGASVEIRRTAPTTFQLFYNDVQRGADQTISDAAIVNNKYFGMFSVKASNTCASFQLSP